MSGSLCAADAALRNAFDAAGADLESAPDGCHEPYALFELPSQHCTTSIPECSSPEVLSALQVFWTVPSPGTLALFVRGDHYSSHQEYVEALGRVLREEYEAIASTGVMLQIDAPDLAMGRHTRWTDLTNSEFCEQIVATNVEAMNMAVRGISSDRIRVHVCWGNYPGPHTKDIEPLHLWPHLVRMRCKYLLMEMANPR